MQQGKLADNEQYHELMRIHDMFIDAVGENIDLGYRRKFKSEMVEYE